MTGAGQEQVRLGYQQSGPPQAPPGVYIDPVSQLVLPQGGRLAGRARVAAALILGVLLFTVTLGIGYIAWSAFTWGRGQTPAQRILNLRCWLPQDGRLAGRDEMAIRQILGFFQIADEMVHDRDKPLLIARDKFLEGVWFVGTNLQHETDVRVTQRKL